MTIQKRNWIYTNQDENKVKLLADALDIKKTTAQLLLNRGISKDTSARKFLDATLEDLYDPFLLKNMDEGVECIKNTIKENQSIWIYGDYDVDGVSSVSIMLKYFKSINYPVNYYIPDRMEEGYGLNKNAIKKITEDGGNLIITVDCGITSIEEVDYANDLGITMIITDHHHCQEELPKARAIINPKQEDCNYPFDMICGCGLALKLIQALTPEEKFKTSVYDYLDIVAIATVADIVPLVDENRIFVKNGLEYMMETNNIGIDALLDVCNLKGKKLNAGHIGFGIAPRINAAGRISSADLGVKLLTTENNDEAKKLAKLLNEENQNRQEIEMEILKEAIAKIELDPRYKEEKILVVYGENWHHGVIGIVASRIVEKYYKPTIVLAIDDTMAKGSARSIPKFNLFEAMSSCKIMFQKFGGHEQAAGLSLGADNIEAFRKKINSIADKVLTEDDLVPQIACDGKLSLEEIDSDLLYELQNLEPHGLGNMSPKFIGLKLMPGNLKPVGNEGKHLKMTIQERKKTFDTIGFNLGQYANSMTNNDEVGIVFSPEFNEFNGTKKIQLNIKDIKIMKHNDMLRNSLAKDYYNTLDLQDDSEELCPIDSEKFKKIPVVCIENKEDYIVKELKLQNKSIILINNLFNVYNLLKALEIQEKHSNTYFKSFFKEGPTLCLDQEVHIVINPNIDKIKFKLYNNIILYDMFFTRRDYNSFLDANNDVNSLILYSSGEENLNEKILKTIIPTRKLLVVLYKILKVNYHKKSTSLEDLVDSINKDFKINTNGKLLKSAISIFEEANIMKCTVEDNSYLLEILPTKEKVDIECVNTYKKCMNIYHQFTNLKKELVSYIRGGNNDGFN
ncbi:MAG: single-stranded-DNA-specific exonuclease RecJ [Clostridiaceae bacterium]|nr:single-stranded-DNA-specific exonuclease RecJ [Clostridiaceae bacterium]